MPHTNCVFCKIIAKQLPAKVINEADDVLVIADIAPKAPVHLLILPKKHVVDLTELTLADQALAGSLLLMANQLAAQLPGNKAFRLVSNNGHDAGQRVFHAHIHFLAGTSMEF